MSVKIDSSSNSLPPLQSGEGKARTPVVKPDNNTPPTATSSTNVNLGSSATQLLNMGNSTASTPTVNATKVAAIKQAISEGRFQVNSGAVADSLIKSVTDLISSKQA